METPERPAFARLLGLAHIVAHKGNLDGISLVKLAVPSMIAMLALIVLYTSKFGSFRHPSFALLVASHVPYLFVEQIGNSEVFRQVAAAVFQ